MRHVILPHPAETADPTCERDGVARRFLRWAETAPAAARSKGARALAIAYLNRDVAPAEREGALLGLTILLDDPSPLVRFALAEALARSADAPHALVTALAHDQSDVARPILAFSPVLTEAELVDAVALGDSAAQSAVADRAYVSVGVAAALAEVGSAEACIALCENPRSDLTPALLARLVERHGEDADLREAVLARPELDAAVRNDLVVAGAAALSRFVADCGWLSDDAAQRLARDATDQATMIIAAETANRIGAPQVHALVVHLLGAGRLTPALILRAALCGNFLFLEAALSELSGLPLSRVAGFTRGNRQVGFGAVYAKAGLPPALLGAFAAAIAERHQGETGAGSVLQRGRIGRALKACTDIADGERSKIFGLLRRFDAEAARASARAFVSEVRDAGRSSIPLLPRVTSEDRGIALRSAA